MTILDHEHRQILEEDAARRLAAERRYAVPGCPWGCDGSGWREIALSEYGPLDAIPANDPAVIVFPHGLIVFPCECNKIVIVGGRVRRWPEWAA